MKGEKKNERKIILNILDGNHKSPMARRCSCRGGDDGESGGNCAQWWCCFTQQIVQYYAQQV